LLFNQRQQEVRLRFQRRYAPAPQLGGTAASLAKALHPDHRRVAIPDTVSSCNNNPPYTQWNNSIIGSLQSGQAADTFSNNLTDTIGVSRQGEVAMFNGDTYSVPPNLENTSTGWVNV
jgi:hypothetical protein